MMKGCRYLSFAGSSPHKLKKWSYKTLALQKLVLQKLILQKLDDHLRLIKIEVSVNLTGRQKRCPAVYSYLVDSVGAAGLGEVSLLRVKMLV